MATDVLARTKVVPVARARYEVCNNAIGNMQRVRRHRDSFICWRYGLPRKPEHVRHSTIPGPDDCGTRARLCGPAASQNGQTLTVHEPITEKYSFPVYNALVRERDGQCAHSWSRARTHTHTQWIITVSWLSYSAYQAKLSSTMRSWRLTPSHSSLSKWYQALLCRQSRREVDRFPNLMWRWNRGSVPPSSHTL